LGLTASVNENQNRGWGGGGGGNQYLYKKRLPPCGLSQEMVIKCKQKEEERIIVYKEKKLGQYSIIRGKQNERKPAAKYMEDDRNEMFCIGDKGRKTAREEPIRERRVQNGNRKRRKGVGSKGRYMR
jgi:hypothetical protein